MHIIDQYAYSNRLRRVDPAYKVGVSFTVLLLCLLLNEPLVGIVAVGWMYLLAVRLAGLSVRTFGRVLFIEGTFMVLTTIGVVLSLSLVDPRNVSPWAVRLGPLWISSSPDSIIKSASPGSDSTKRISPGSSCRSWI